MVLDPPLLKTPPLREIDGVLDYLMERDDYVENYEQIASDDLKAHLMPDEVKDVLLNCCQVAMTPDVLGGGTVVDVGCAYGHILHAVPADRRVGIDIALDYLKAVDPACVRIRCNAESIPLEDGVADIVICTDVFEHVRDERLLAKEIIRILAPCGTLLLATPWEQDLSVYETEEYIRDYKRYSYVHLRSVNERMIRESFPGFEMRSSTLVTVGMKHMRLKPYPIRFMQLQASGHRRHARP